MILEYTNLPAQEGFGLLESPAVKSHYTFHLDSGRRSIGPYTCCPSDTCHTRMSHTMRGLVQGQGLGLGQGQGEGEGGEEDSMFLG